MMALDIWKYSKEHPGEPINIVAHSHGGNVAIVACNILKLLGVEVNNLVFLGTPVLDDYQLSEGAVKNPVSFFHTNDQVQKAGALIEGADGNRVRYDAYNVTADQYTNEGGAVGSHTSMTESPGVISAFLSLFSGE